MRKRWLLVPLLVLPLYGCDEEYCDLSVENPIDALLVGFIVCQGRNPKDNAPPSASFTLTPDAVTDGGTVRLDASASADPDGEIVRYEWDVDGLRAGDDDAFEIDGGDSAILERSVSAGTGTEVERSIGLRVTDDRGKSAKLRKTLTIRPGGGAHATFTIEPNPAVAGQPVTFDAAGSSAAAAYGWDFDDDGQLDERSRLARTTHVYETPGERVVRLHVESLLGGSAEARATLAVLPAPSARGADAAAIARAAVRVPARRHRARAAAAAGARAPRNREQPAARSRPRGRRFRARLTGVSFPADLGAGTRQEAVVRFSPVRAAGRLVPARGRLGALPRFRAADWVARLAFAADPGARAVSIRGLVLATLPGGRACLRLGLRGLVGDAATGRFKLIGGTDAAGRLSVRGRFRHHFTGTELRLRGRVRSREREPRPLPPRCARLVRPRVVTARDRGDKDRVRRFLRGRRFSTFRSTTIDPPSSIERHYDFCRGGRVRYESVFINTGSEEPAIDVRTGRWRVARARISDGGFGTARIGLVADSGERGAIAIAASPRGFRLDGDVAEVTRSPVCG